MSQSSFSPDCPLIMEIIGDNTSEVFLTINDIFDELKNENERLNTELVFAEKCLNRLKTVLIKWHDKYGLMIEDQDKLEFIELKTILNAIHQSKERTNHSKIVCTEPNCGKLFKNKNNLRIHLKTAHSPLQQTKPIACSFDSCQYRCRTQHVMLQHMTSHSDLRLFNCEAIGCDKSFKNARGLREHSFSHSAQPSLKCQFDGCDLLFQTVWHRKNHMNVVHLGKNSNDRPVKHCDWPGCDYTTRFAHQMNKHKRLHTGEKPFACDWPACGKRFRLRQQMIDHKNIHNNVKPYVCHWPGCSYRCSDSANLRKHVRTSHNCVKTNNLLQVSNGQLNPSGQLI